VITLDDAGGTVSKWNDLEQHCEVMADASPVNEQMPDVMFITSIIVARS